MNTLLIEQPRASVRIPLVLLAQQEDGRYSRPVEVYAIDFRLEDNPHIPREYQQLRATWIARHPTHNRYIVYVEGNLVDLAASPERLYELQHSNILPPDVYRLPEHGEAAWWEWAEGLDGDYRPVKAPKRVRPGEMSQLEMDNANLTLVGAESLERRLDRLFHAGAILRG